MTSKIITKEAISEWFMGLQDRICAGLESEDDKGKFREDLWQRAEGGGGRTRIIQGRHIEKGGVNYSAVHGPMPQKIAAALKLPEANFYATGVSIVLHPINPHVPIIHMNVRYFEMDNGTWWFGGGIDLTPHYIAQEDAQFFHQQLKNTCDKHDPSYYPKFKQWADDYFYIKHRKETRGVGGIFFDRLNRVEGSFEQADRLAFTQAIGETFLPTYIHLLRKNKDKSYTDSELEWQRVRRGRYVEFNLVWDKGTRFGLDTDGRIESILMSMPPQANWLYNHQPEAGSPEDMTQQLLKKNINWIEKR